VDKATNEPIANVAVTIDAVDADGQPLSDTTNAAGEFAFTNVPAQESESGGVGATGDYSVHFNTEAADGNYRDNLRVEATLKFANNEAGSDGDPNNLGASITLPLGELTGSVTGEAYVQSDASGDRLPAAGVPVTLYRTDVLEYDASGSSTGFGATGTVRVTTDTTAGDGSFSFASLPEGLASGDYQFEWSIGGDQITYNGPSGYRDEIPLSTDGNPDRNLGELDVTSQVEQLAPFQITSAPRPDAPGPASNIDKSTDRPVFEFAFNRPVAATPLTVNANGELPTTNFAEPNLVTAGLDLTKTGEKDVGADGEVTLEARFGADGDSLLVRPTEALEDGAQYDLTLAASGDNIFSGNNIAEYFVDAAFQQNLGGSGQPAVQDGVSDVVGNSILNFSIGDDQTKPAAPEIVVEDVTSSGKPDSLDYTDNSVTIQHRVVDTSSVELCENCDAVEVFARTKGESFQSVQTTDNVEFGETNTLTLSLSNFPLQEDDGNGPAELEVKAKVRSLNGVESDFSTSVGPLGDNESVEVVGAQYFDTNGDGDVDELEVDFDEPLDKSTVEANDFDVNDTATGNPSDLGSVQRTNNTTGGATVTISVTTDNSANDEVTVDGVTDLSGNGVNNNSDTATP